MASKASKSNLFLSKTLFLRGLQCQKSLHLYKNSPELRDEVDEALEAKFQSGREVGVLAQKLFPGGVEIKYEDSSLSEQIAQTKAAIQSGARVLYEAAFRYDDLFIKADIMRLNRGKWEVHEVKASSEVKDVHLSDLAFQHHVISGSGVPVSKLFLVHIDTEYVRNGEIEPEKLFKIVDQTKEVSDLQSTIQINISELRKILSGKPPVMDIGEQCSDPYDCDFRGHCWKHIPENSVFDLRNRGVRKFDLYRQGIIKLKDIPLDMLSGKQRIQVEAFVNKRNSVNKGAVNSFLSSVEYPISFMDFETTAMVPIPMFDGTRPYQNVPFQYSLHVQRTKDAEVEHFEYLAPEKSDPRKPFLESLLGDLPEKGTVLTYNKAFEIRNLGYLKEWLPQYKTQISSLIDRVVDLMVPFQKGDVYYWKMNGSYSIKSVLPALVPDLGYDDLGISDGGMASMAWLSTWEMDNPAEVKETRDCLMEYCGLDTFGMVKIMEELRRHC